MSEVKKTSGIALNDEGDEWTVNCPQCGKENQYEGFFDPDDESTCKACGTVFVTTHLNCEDGGIIK